MKLSHPLQLKLSKPLEPSSLVPMKYKGNDLAVKTDGEGNAVFVFIGKKQPDGKIKGQRYARTLKKDENGKIIKDHWEQKGNAS